MTTLIKKISSHRNLFFLFAAVLLLMSPEVLAETSIVGTVMTTMIGWLRDLAHGLFSLGKSLFFLVIQFTIFDFASYWKGSGVAGELKSLWQLMRDIANIFIVVLFIVTAFLTIFGDFFFKRKILFGLLAAAVVVNFSAFFVLALFDISHAFFLVAFNILDTQTLSGSLFDGYGTRFVSNDSTWNVLYGLVFAVSYFFMFLGFIYLSIILIERFIIAIILVVTSPLAVLAFFVSISGSMGKIDALFSLWKDKLVTTLINPVVLMFGLAFLMAIYSAVLNQIPKPENLPQSMGSNGMEILVQLILATFALVLGIFKIGQMVQGIRVGKFQIGKYMKQAVDRIVTLNRGRLPLGTARTAARPVTDRFSGRLPRTRLGRNLRDTAVGVAGGARDAWRGKRAEFSTPESRKRRADERQTARTVNSGTFEEQMAVSKRSTLTQGQFNRLFSNPDLHQSLVSNTNITDNEIDRIAESNNDQKTLLAAINNPNISEGTLQNIINRTNQTGNDIYNNQRIRGAAVDTLNKLSTGKEPPKLSKDEKVRVIRKALEENDRDTLLRYAGNQEEDLQARLTVADMTNMPDDVFKALLKGTNTQIIRKILDHPDTNAERLETILNNTELTNREVRRMAQEKLDALRGNRAEENEPRQPNESEEVGNERPDGDERPDNENPDGDRNT